MLHLVATVFFLACLAGIGTLLVAMLRADAAGIVAALVRERPVAAPRPWASRVRQVAPARPSGPRYAAQREAA